MISVIFSIYNSEGAIGQILEAFRTLVNPPQRWIVVDNASTDGTADIVKTFAVHLPMLLLSVPRRSKNFALNQAIEHAEGELVVFTNCDAEPGPNWLCNLRECALSRPAYGLFGKNIPPHSLCANAWW